MRRGRTVLYVSSDVAVLGGNVSHHRNMVVNEVTARVEEIKVRVPDRS